MKDKAFMRIARMMPMYERELLTLPDELKLSAYDIRLKLGQPLTICAQKGMYYMSGNGRVTRNLDRAAIYCRESEFEELFLRLCDHSVFSHENEISQGFISVGRAYRVGICGTAVLQDGSINNIRDIESMVFRIPREKRGCARELFSKSQDFTKGILIAGEPSSGKTTFLRDIVQTLSFGDTAHAQKRLAVLDERYEIESIFDLGPGADVFKGYPKSEGFSMALRSMSPQLIVCDELSDKDLKEVENSMFCGVPVIASIHSTKEELLKRRGISSLIKKQAFGSLVFLKGRDYPSQVSSIVKAGDYLEAVGSYADNSQRTAVRSFAGAAAEKKGDGAA